MEASTNLLMKKQEQSLTIRTMLPTRFWYLALSEPLTDMGNWRPEKISKIFPDKNYVPESIWLSKSTIIFYVKNTNIKRTINSTSKNAINMIWPLAPAFFITIATFFCRDKSWLSVWFCFLKDIMEDYIWTKSLTSNKFRNRAYHESTIPGESDIE